MSKLAVVLGPDMKDPVKVEMALRSAATWSIWCTMAIR